MLIPTGKEMTSMLTLLRFEQSHISSLNYLTLLSSVPIVVVVPCFLYDEIFYE